MVRPWLKNFQKLFKRRIKWCYFLLTSAKPLTPKVLNLYCSVLQYQEHTNSSKNFCIRFLSAQHSNAKDLLTLNASSNLGPFWTYNSPHKSCAASIFCCRLNINWSEQMLTFVIFFVLLCMTFLENYEFLYCSLFFNSNMQKANLVGVVWRDEGFASRIYINWFRRDPKIRILVRMEREVVYQRSSRR